MLQIFHHENFKGGPALVFAGSALEISLLWETFRSWNGDDLNLLESLRGGAEVVLNGVKSITLSRAKAEKDSYLQWANEHGVWWVSRRGQPRIIGMLEVLKDSDHPAHQYLDIGNADGIQILCAKDEYSSL